MTRKLAVSDEKGSALPDLEAAVAAAPAEPLPEGAFCPNCSYDLRGLTSNRCPECGEEIDALRATTSQLPWVHRRDIGRLRAYWRTVGVVMFRQRRFRNEIVRPVDYAAAQRFRWVTILHVAVPVLAALVVVYAGHVAKPFSRTNEVAVVMLRWVWPVGVVYAAFLLFLLAATGMPSYFFHPKAVPVVQQNRAIALSYYASGPLALMALPLLALAAGWVVGFDHLVGMFFLLLGAILPLALMAVWWLDLIHLSFRLLPQRRGRAFLIAIMVPVLWFALGLLFVGGVSAGAAYIWLVFASLP